MTEIPVDEAKFASPEQFQLYCELVDELHSDEYPVECVACVLLQSEFDPARGPPTVRRVSIGFDSENHDFGPGCVILRVAKVMEEADVESWSE